jgi:hypothetical protein
MVVPAIRARPRRGREAPMNRKKRLGLGLGELPSKIGALTVAAADQVARGLRRRARGTSPAKAINRSEAVEGSGVATPVVNVPRVKR